jgi:DNA-binding CsgD family transcriptional regulator
LDNLKKTDSKTFIQKVATTCYITAFVVFNIILLFYQLGNITNRYGFLITIDALSLVISWGSFILFSTKRIWLKLATAILSYTIFTNTIASDLYISQYSANISSDFLVGTLIFCINIFVVGFCSGRIHLLIANIYYIIAYLLLLYISHDQFLFDNALTIILIVIALSVGLSAFLKALSKVYKKEFFLKQELHEKETMLISEQADKLNLKLELKQKELTTKTIYLLKLVESNNAFVTKLNGLKKDIAPSGLGQFENILNEHQVTHYSSYWKEFETCFHEVHDGFYKKLQNSYPDLTPAERRMAAFIRLDLSTKQIADITFNTTHSVEVARSRLRKKLNLSTQTNLKNFLNKL